MTPDDTPCGVQIALTEFEEECLRSNLRAYSDWPTVVIERQLLTAALDEITRTRQQLEKGEKEKARLREALTEIVAVDPLGTTCTCQQIALRALKGKTEE